MIDVSDLEGFARRCETAMKDMKPYAGKFLEEIGEEFLDIVQANIVSAGNVDTEKLLGSFEKGGEGNIFQLNTGNLTLTVGTNIEYARWVNDGHSQQPGRFIPGVWNGKRFIYQPGASNGMVLKASFVAGSHYFDKSVEVLEALFPSRAKSSFEQFFRRYFS